MKARNKRTLTKELHSGYEAFLKYLTVEDFIYHNCKVKNPKYSTVYLFRLVEVKMTRMVISYGKNNTSLIYNIVQISNSYQTRSETIFWIYQQNFDCVFFMMVSIDYKNLFSEFGVDFVQKLSVRINTSPGLKL